MREKTEPLLVLIPILVLLFSVTNSSELPTQNHLQVAHSTCEGTLYPDLCVSTLSTFPDLTSKTIPQVICSVLNFTIKEVKSSSSNCTGLRYHSRSAQSILDKRALDDCINLFDTTVEEIKTTISDLSQAQTTIASVEKRNCQTLLSGAMTNVYTCLDGFAYSKSKLRKKIENSLNDISSHVSNSLAMLKKVPGVKSKTSNSEAFPEYGKVKDGFPTWVSPKDRKLLQTATNQTKFNLVVAKDGSGHFTTIGAAIAAAPNSSPTRFLIHIKAGTYLENVDVPKKKTNLMLVGDGIGKTVVKASRNVVDGWTTFQSSTFAVVGDNFIAKGITFENSAGASKHQAVALRSGADFSAFYQCSFVAYQDTLYVHSLRQFYRECDVYGTVDFIFGNAAVVFQNCNLYARKPDPKQKNLFTAQGREDPNQNTGISIINSKVTAAADLIPVKSTFKTYLGRPWKKYSRTVYLNSFLDDLIDPAGWLEWDGTFALDTLYYGEYNNRGPGSNTAARVKWPGYKVITSTTEASQFTVRQFIQGNEWLSPTGIPFFPDLS
jgi:pectinesterase